MTYARSEVVSKDEVSVYHCVSRCVRRAFLCGKDTASNCSYEHRREWIRKRLSTLCDIFSIEVISYAVMSNHLHSLIKVRPDLSKKWSDEEVARRWRLLFPLRIEKGVAAPPSSEEIKAITSSNLVETYRERLTDLSWFNRCLNENIARRANKEDKCKGRFWEGRFRCQRVFDVAGILACSAYIDLNPIRAGMAKDLESSDHTSIQDRIHKASKVTPKRCQHWSKVPLVSIPEASGRSVTLKEYLTLVEETGKQVREGKKCIPVNVAPILKRLKINEDSWVDATQNFRYHFKRIVGPKEEIEKAAKRANKNWFQGLRAASQIFGGSSEVAVT